MAGVNANPVLPYVFDKSNKREGEGEGERGREGEKERGSEEREGREDIVKVTVTVATRPEMD